MNNPNQLDPVCGMAVSADDTPARASHEGVRYHFCSPGCRDRFVRDPPRYLRDGPDSPPGRLSSVASIVVEEELSRELARLRAGGLNRAQVQRELYHLSRAASEVLIRAGLPARQTAAMIELLDRRLVSLLEWKTDSDRAYAWALPT